MTHGEPEIDPHGSDIARFYDHHKTAQHIAARAIEGYNKTYGIVHPMEQWASNRPIRLSPALRAPRRARRRVLRGRRLGAAVLVRHERVAPRRVRRPGHAPRGRVGVALVVADHQRRAPRDARPGRASSTCRRSRSSTSPGPGALAALEQLCVNKVDVAVGRTVYTPLLNAAGGILADLTIMRLGDDRFRVVTGGGMGMRDRKIFQDAPAGRRLGAAPRRHERLHDVRAVGPAGARHPRRGVRRQRRHQPQGLPVPVVEDGRHRRGPDARVADQLRRRARLGDLRPDRAGPPGLGRPLARRPAARHGPGGDRHVRGHVAAREGLPRPRRRAGARLRPRRGRHGPADRSRTPTSSGGRPTSSNAPAARSRSSAR